VEQGTNGYVKWRELDERLRREADELNKRLDRAHNYANERLDTIDTDIVSLGAKLDTAVERETGKVHVSLGKLDGRVDDVESSLDQMRGARALVYFLIGSNLMVVVGLIIAVLIAVT